MRRLRLALLLPLLALRLAAAPSLTIEVDRPDARYQPGETVTFSIRLDPDGAPAPAAVRWTLSRDGAATLDTGEAALSADGRATVSGTLPGPGFLLLHTELASLRAADGKPLFAYAGAALAPEEIRPGLPPPDDFDDFWAAQKRALAAVPANLRLTPVATEDGLEIFDLQADCPGGAPVSGYLARPAGSAPGSLPALLTMQGAGVRDSGLATVKLWAKRGMIAVNINAHGLPNGRPDAFYAEQARGPLANYWARGRDSRDTSYFLGMFLRVLRTIDAIAAQPEWDGRTLVAHGTSQGGAQAIVAGALDPRVTLVVAGVPAMCDHAGLVAGRASGWPKWVKTLDDGRPNPAQLEASRYYDMANFAARARQPAYFTVGYIDRTCPPASVYAMRNAWAGPSEIFDDIPTGHRNSNEAMNRMAATIRRHVAQRAAAD